MDEQEAERAALRAEISKLAGQINIKKTGRHEQHAATRPYAPYHPYAARGGGRWQTRGRGGRAGYHQPVQHRVWVAGDTPTPPSTEPPVTPRADTSTTSPAGKATPNGFYVPSQGFGKKELMNKETYEREQKQQQEYKQARANEGHQNGNAHAITPKKSTSPKNEQNSRQITIEGITFQVCKDGSKLIRVSDIYNAIQETPRKAAIAGVEFVRTKRGNLIRAPGKGDRTRFNNAAPKRQCEMFTRQGSCPFGPKCHFAHDPEKVAICKAFLMNGSCSAGDYCDLSHEMTYHRVSACSHFLRGNCTNDPCRYPHINVSLSAPVCRAFAVFGYCEAGELCPRRHVNECPDHANRGLCTNDRCLLPHFDRANVLRKAARRQAKIGSEGESDLSSDDGNSDQESEVDDADGDGEDAIMAGVDDRHELSQQQDYISFS